MKKLCELKKEDKIEVIKAVVRGSVNRAELSPESLVAKTGQDGFMALMMSAGDQEGPSIICIGEAETFLKGIESIE